MSTPKEEQVRVAVRVRPFREVDRGCKRIVDVEGDVILLTNPTDPTDQKSFTFDHSYWSFDGFIQDTSGKYVADPNQRQGTRYCSQERLFNDLGRAMLADAFEGYNTTLFSYGQTGSGKSYSVMGYGPNEGIIPQFCHQIFCSSDQTDTPLPNINHQLEVHLSMMEIYNETVYDLLNPSKNGKGLKVREHPKKGFYADGLSSFLVNSYSEINQLIGQGTLNRTVVATNMNATSSRSHTIVTLELRQNKNTQNGKVTTTAVVSIVDLAGSERVSKVGNTSGERFREGVAINQSLQCLGHCIHALAESSTTSASSHVSNSNQKTQRIPYRDSVLTKLLRNALGGNSRTIMIASISPADIHYEETLSTLRYADRAKQIRTRATVNANSIDKLERDLKEENQRLKAFLNHGKIDPQWLKTTMKNYSTNPQKSQRDAKKRWEEEIRAQIADNEREINHISTPQKERQLHQLDVDKQYQPIESQSYHESPGSYIQNINMDPLLNGRWIHHLKNGVTTIGKTQTSSTSIQMIGPGMQPKHAEMSVIDDKVTIRSLTKEGRILVNGLPIEPFVQTSLQPNDRLVFGATQLWLFRQPALEAEAGVSECPMINYDFVVHEMATKSGLDVFSNSLDGSLQEELLTILPSVEEANEISVELNKNVKFEIIIVSPRMLKNSIDNMIPSQLYIKMKNLENGTEYLWSKEKFLTRYDFMKDLYRHFQQSTNEEGDSAKDFHIPEDRDPFLESSDAVVVIGIARVFLQSLAHLMEIQENVPITDLRGIQVGSMEIALLPCADAEGNQLQDEDTVATPAQLIGKNLYFQFHIIGCRNLPPKFRDLHCKYRLYGDKTDSRTKMHPFSPYIQFNHSRMLSYKSATREFVDYLNHGSIVVEVLGKHLIHSRSIPLKGTAKLISDDQEIKSRLSESGKNISYENINVLKTIDGGKQELLTELQLLKQTHIRLQQRLDSVRQITDQCLLAGKESIPTALLDALLDNPEQALQFFEQRPTEDDAEWVEWNTVIPQREQRSSVCTLS